MLIKTLFISAFFMLTLAANGQNTLKVELNNLKSNDGVMSLELVDKDDKFVQGKIEKIENNKCVVTFNNLKEGKYVIRYFHDENSNKKLDTNKIGIPIEGYGFSNDAYGKFGPKSFEKMLFKVSGNTVIKLKTKY